MVPILCPALTMILHYFLSSANSPLTNHPHIIDIPPHTIFPSQPRSTSFPPSLLLQPIPYLCNSLFLHPNQIPSPLQPAFYQSPHQAHLHTIFRKEREWSGAGRFGREWGDEGGRAMKGKGRALRARFCRLCQATSGPSSLPPPSGLRPHLSILSIIPPLPLPLPPPFPTPATFHPFPVTSDGLCVFKL